MTEILLSQAISESKASLLDFKVFVNAIRTGVEFHFGNGPETVRSANYNRFDEMKLQGLLTQ